MSDFGAIIKISKKKKIAFNIKEIEEISIACQKLKSETSLTNSFSEPYLFEVGQIISLGSDLCHEVNVLLSNHWGDSIQFKWHKEINAKDMKLIANSLQLLLSNDYKLQTQFTWW